ncbi:hypothetical protein [Comamonas sp. JC664]|uniref:hypothetical protein n=1 Tax=Comamonas sp. JC664 TaxID=2801917 RepID=UPI00361F15A3
MMSTASHPSDPCGTVVNADREERADVLLWTAGLWPSVKGLRPSTAGTETLDASGQYVMPVVSIRTPICSCPSWHGHR